MENIFKIFGYILLVLFFSNCVSEGDSNNLLVEGLPLEPNFSIIPEDIITGEYKKTDSNHQIVFENLSEDSIGQGFVLTFDSSKIYSQYWVMRIESDDEKEVERVVGKYAGMVICGSSENRYIIKNLSSRLYFIGSTLKQGNSIFLTIIYEFPRSLDSDTW